MSFLETAVYYLIGINETCLRFERNNIREPFLCTIWLAFGNCDNQSQNLDWWGLDLWHYGIGLH